MTKKQQHNVQPIKDEKILKEVQDTLLHNFQAGRRNYTIFQLGKATMLRVSDLLSLHYSDVFLDDGQVRARIYTKDQNTGKANKLYLKPIAQDLLHYQDWLFQHHLTSHWLFPSLRNPNTHLTRKQYYKIMTKVGDLLGVSYLGTHTMRKTGAYRVYEQTDYNIGFVMDLLNHSNQSATLSYLGLDEITKEELLDQIDFG